MDYSKMQKAQLIEELEHAQAERRRVEEALRESEERYPRLYSLHTITNLEPGDHLCCLYETEEEHRAVLTLFLRQGLERGEKVVYIVDARTAEIILDYLRDDGLDIEPHLASGQLVILTRDDSYMREGVFDPDGMVALLRAETEQALAEGYPALRVTGEMTWALRGLPGSERLVEYEAKLNQFFPGSQCLAICQYDRRRFAPEVLLDVLRTHPIAVVGTEVYDNFYYIPPAELLSGDLPSVELRHWLENLAERKRAEEALRESKAKFRMIYDTANAIIMAHDRDFKVVYMNPYACKVLGYEEGEMIGKDIRPMLEKSEYERAETVRQQVTIDPNMQVEGFEQYYLKKGGGRILISWNVTALKDAEGNAVGILGVGQDITKRKRAEEERERLLADLEAKNRELESFVYTVSHDLRAPLVSIDGFSSVLQKEFYDQLGQQGQHYLDRIQANVSHMDALIGHLLALSRIGRVVGPIEEIDVSGLLAEIQQELALRLEEAGAEFVVQEPLPTIRADRDRIRQVFTNLIDNAIKFRSQERPLRIEVGGLEEDGFYRFHVADNGTGIAPQYHELIFAPFRQLDPQTEGVGMGLALVKKIVEHHGGRVGVESEEGKGATFYFTLPK